MPIFSATPQLLLFLSCHIREQAQVFIVCLPLYLFPTSEKALDLKHEKALLYLINLLVLQFLVQVLRSSQKPSLPIPRLGQDSQSISCEPTTFYLSYRVFIAGDWSVFIPQLLTQDLAHGNIHQNAIGWVGLTCSPLSMFANSSFSLDFQLPFCFVLTTLYPQLPSRCVF